MRLHHPYFLIFLYSKCNIVVINIKFKFIYSEGRQLIYVTEIFRVNVIVFLMLSVRRLLFAFQYQLDAHLNLQQAFLKQCIFQKPPWLPFYPLFELTLLKHLFYLSSRLIIVVVQFYPWFKFYFLLFLGFVIYDNEFKKQRKIKFEPRIKLNPNIIIRFAATRRCFRTR